MAYEGKTDKRNRKYIIKWWREREKQSFGNEGNDSKVLTVATMHSAVFTP